MQIDLSERVGRVRPSPTLAVTALAAQLKSQGRDIISLGAGEPDFDTPEHIRAAAIDAINRGFTRYTAVEGIPPLRQAVVEKMRRDHGLSYTIDQVLVSVGGKQSFFNMAQALLNPGDEVIIPAPYWVSYPDMVLLADGVPVIVEATQAQGFKLTPEQLEAHIGPRTRLVVLNSPSNPTGVAYTRAELIALGEVLRRHPRVLVATDDMYEKILWAEEAFCNIVMACPDLYERTIVLNGVSKAYAMTGWRIGYACGPQALIQAMAIVQSQSTSNPCSVSQVAAQAALEGGDACIRPMLEAFKARHDFVVGALNAIPGVRCLPSQGAFYGFPNVEPIIERMGMKDDIELASHLLHQAGVALVPGSAFGSAGHLRLSYATGMDALKKALERLHTALS
ncbi:MAG: pyridoxal phosphate-dependent aminotransferase [Halothiobacillaceae bacterium]|nr:pyridoxal phosphate-dependent aminotransferase [Halothiobacillaceae bacterium]MDY0050160.1 pyridoxal phosphate-dependent aminotransferase [Halothiobacillaceae bacterium]